MKRISIWIIFFLFANIGLFFSDVAMQRSVVKILKPSMPRQRDASPVRFKYQDIGPAKFKWNDLKEQIQSLDLGSKVEANLIKHGKFGHVFFFCLC